MNKEQKALVDKLDAEIEQAQLEIDRLEARTKEVEADARLDMQDQIDKLKKKRKAAAEKLDELKDSGGHAFEDIRAGVEQAWHTLSSATKRAADRFR